MMLSGKTALVTGGASGIGEACARLLAARGAHVTVADLDDVAAKALADEIDGTAWAVDLLDTDQLVDLALETDILVNNAGIQRVSPIEDFDVEDFRKIQRLMVEAPFLLVRAALPYMYRKGFGAHRQRFLGPRAPRFGIQECVRHGKARTRRPVESCCARGCPTRCHQ